MKLKQKYDQLEISSTDVYSVVFSVVLAVSGGVFMFAVDTIAFLAGSAAVLLALVFAWLARVRKVKIRNDGLVSQKVIKGAITRKVFKREEFNATDASFIGYSLESSVHYKGKSRGVRSRGRQWVNIGSIYVCYDDGRQVLIASEETTDAKTLLEKEAEIIADYLGIPCKKKSDFNISRGKKTS